MTSRLSGLLTVAYIAFYIAAIFVPNWSATEELTNIALDLVDKAGANGTVSVVGGDTTFSLDSWCMETEIPNWNNDKFPVCFDYMDNVEVCNFTDTGTKDVCEKLTGCERFGSVCYVRQVVKISLAIGIIAGVFAGTMSEKGYPTTTGLQGISMLAGIVAMGMWVNWSSQQTDANAKDFKLGLGGWLITIGWIMALLSMGLSALDQLTCCCCGEKKDKPGAMNDGISAKSRFSSFLSVMVWILLLVAVGNPKWSSVDKLGNSGDFCVGGGVNTTATETLCDTRNAEFGIWIYCLDEDVPKFGTDPVQICVGWNDAITITGEVAAADDVSGSGAAPSVARTGVQRFDAEAMPSLDITNGIDGFGVKGKRTLSGIMIIASALFAIFTDIYSEKNWIGMVTMFLSSMTGMIAMASWVAFQAAFTARGDSAGVTFDEGGWVLVVAWVGALFSWLGYVFSHREAQADDAPPSGTMERRGSQQTHV